MKIGQGRIGLVKDWNKMAAAGLAAAIMLVSSILTACGGTVQPRPSPGPTSTYNPTEVFRATEESARSTRIAPFGNTCPEDKIIQNMSPGDKWTVCDGPNSMTVLNKQNQKWTFSYKHDFGASNGIDHTNLIHWSLEEHLLYFAPMPIMDGNSALPYNALALYKMDLSSGDVQMVLPPVKNNNSLHFYTLSISPTGQRLAYISETSNGDPAEIVVRNLHTGEQKSIHPGASSESVGWFTWSPDGTEMTYVVYDPSIDRSFYFTYDMITFQLIRSEPFNP